jgi:hypothetical protein
MRRIGKGGAILALALAAGCPSKAAQPPAIDEDTDVFDQLLQAHLGVEGGTIALDPPSKASVDVLGSDAIPEKAAPSFGTRHISIRGATRLAIAGSGASVVAYEGDLGHFEIISIKATPAQVPGLGAVPFNGNRYYAGTRKGTPGDLSIVGVVQGSRLTCLVGSASSLKLAELAAMIPR